MLKLNVLLACENHFVLLYYTWNDFDKINKRQYSNTLKLHHLDNLTHEKYCYVFLNYNLCTTCEPSTKLWWITILILTHPPDLIIFSAWYLSSRASAIKVLQHMDYAWSYFHVQIKERHGSHFHGPSNWPHRYLE